MHSVKITDATAAKAVGGGGPVRERSTPPDGILIVLFEG
jgi:hypothetical protein